MEEKIKEIISSQKEIKEVKVSNKLEDDLEMDELDRVEIVMALEEEFGIEIPNKEYEN